MNLHSILSVVLLSAEHFLFSFLSLSVCVLGFWARLTFPHTSSSLSLIPQFLLFAFPPLPQAMKMVSFILYPNPSLSPLSSRGLSAAVRALGHLFPVPHRLVVPLGKKGVLPLAFSIWYTSGFLLAPPGVEGVGGNLVWARPGEGGSLGAPAPLAFL